MKIAFLLPMPTTKIVGGYKIVYDYANYLAEKDNEVTIFFDSNKGKNSKGLPKFITYLLRNAICHFEPRWFNLSKEVKKINLYSFQKKFFESYDVVISTAAETAVFANQLSVSKKVYLIQDFENNWTLDYDKLVQTYNYNMDIVVISKWLKKKVMEVSSNKVTYIPNGIDGSVFFNKRYDRPTHSICMLYHLDARKDFDTGYQVLMRLKAKFPDLVVNIFGTPKRPKKWPSWMRYIRLAKPNQVSELMNHSNVFLCTSKKEGFGLTGLESIFCGCTFVTTDCGGVREYASHKSALISPVEDIESLVSNISMVFESEDLRRKLLKENLKIINEFDLDKSREKFRKVVMGS